MDPDGMFIILLSLVYLVLLLISVIGLTRKITRTKWPLAIKIIIPVLLVAFLIRAPWYFIGTVYTPDTLYQMDLLIAAGALLIGLNWSLNIARNIQFRPGVSASLVIIVLTVVFTVLLPLSLHLIGQLFDSMNIMGSSS